jgi:hypothetical protein
VEFYLLAFDTDPARIVTQQVALTAANDANTGPRIDLLIARSAAAFESFHIGGSVMECDLFAKLTEAGTQRGYRYDPGRSLFVPDDGSAGISDATLREKVTLGGDPVTYTCTPHIGALPPRPISTISTPIPGAIAEEGRSSSLPPTFSLNSSGAAKATSCPRS